MPPSTERFMTLNDAGQEVPADEQGRPLEVIPGPENNGNDPEPEYVDDVEDVGLDAMDTVIPDSEEEEPLPEDIGDNCLIISTESGWVTFKPEHIQDEKHVLVLILKGKADSFIPKLGSKFTCHWKDSKGELRTEPLYYAGMRLKLPQIPDSTLLGFVKRS